MIPTLQADTRRNAIILNIIISRDGAQLQLISLKRSTAAVLVNFFWHLQNDVVGRVTGEFTVIATL